MNAQIKPAAARADVDKIADLLAKVGAHKLPVAHMVCNEPPPRDYLFGGLSLTSGVYALLHAAGNSSKTYALLEMIATLALAGVPGCNYDPLRLQPQPAPGGTGWKCLFVSGEDPDDEIWKRLYRIASAAGAVGREALQRNVTILSTLGANPRALITDAALQELVQVVSAGARLIVFDTLARFNGVDEKDNTLMSGVVACFERIAVVTHAAVIVAHHDNKAARGWVPSEMIGVGFRGAACIWDNARWSGTIRPGPGGARVFMEDKFNFGTRHDDRYLLWIDDETRGPIVAADEDAAAELVARFEAERKTKAKQDRAEMRAHTNAAQAAVDARSHGAPVGGDLKAANHDLY